MTSTPWPDPARDALLDRLADQLADVGRQVETIRTELGTLRAPAPGSAPVTGPAPVPAPAWTPGPPTPWPPPAGWGPPPPPPPAPPRRTRRPDPARLLAIAGAVVTLLGVVMLLVLAASRGWFGPEARVIGGAAFGVALAGAGLRLRAAGRPGAETGAVALVGTGVAALYLDVAAATSLYDFLPVPAGLALALAVAGAGLALADRWRHRDLGIGVLVGVDLLVPVVVEALTPLTVVFLLVAQAVALPVARRRDWPALAAVAAAGTALGALAAAVRTAATDLDRPGAVAVLGAVAAAALLTALLDAARPRAGGRGLRAALVLISPLPAVLVLAAGLPRGAGAAVCGTVVVLLAVLGAVLEAGRLRVRPGARDVFVPAVVVAGAVVALEGVLVAFRGAAQGGTVIAVALVLAVLATRVRRGAVLVAAAGVAAVGTLLAVFRDVPLSLLVDGVRASRPLDRGDLLGVAAVAGLLLASVVALLVALARRRMLASRDQGVLLGGGLGVVGLYGATGLVVALALAVAPTRTGFLAGHVLVTVSWTAVALVLLVRGVTAVFPRVCGGVLVVAALSKLLLFDLTALDGLARVAAFLGAGVVLLVAGTRYARLVAESDRTQAVA